MLGKIKKIELRKAWKHEAKDFTQWLAEPENLALLSEEIEIDIKVIQTEAKIGNFNVDILAEETNNPGRKIIIENQLESTNHDHLGKLITYASGYNAEVIIWIVEDYRPEHQKAIDWLNEHTDENINFFLIKMELWQIGDSPFAPVFRIISDPNDWAKALKTNTGNSELSDTKTMQLDFWNKFKEYASVRKTSLRLRKAHPQHWYDLSYGNSESHISLTVNTNENKIACEIYIHDSKKLYLHLLESKKEIEHELNEKMEWMELPNKKASRIKISTEGNIEEADKWGVYFEWLVNQAEKMQKVFGKYTKNYKR